MIKKNNAIVAIAGFAFFYIIFGYRYFANGGVEYIPLVKRAINPGYMKNDYYLNLIDEGYNHRLVFVEFTSKISNLLGSVELSFLFTYIVFMLLSFLGTALLLDYFNKNIWKQILSIFIAIIIWYVFVRLLSPGNVSIIQAELTPNVISRAFLIWALVFSFRQRLLLSGVLLVLSSAFQPVDALLGLPLVVLIAVFWQDGGWATDWRNKIPLATILSLVCIMIIFAMNHKGVGGNDSSIFVELAKGRFRHHYDIHSWPLYKWGFLLVISSFGISSFWLLGHREIATITSIVLIGLITYFILLHHFPIPLLYKIQGAKLMWGNYFLWGLGIAAFLVKFCEPLFSRISKIIRLNWISSFMVSGIIAFIIVIGHKTLMPSNAILAFEKRILFTLSALSKGNYRTAEDYADLHELQLGDWLRANTAPDSVILHPPQLTLIRALSERSSVVQHFLAGFSPSAMKEWKFRMERLNQYCRLSLDYLRESAHMFGADVIAVPNNCKAAQDSKKLATISDSWSIFNTITHDEVEPSALLY